jgi:chitodextrinase
MVVYRKIWTLFLVVFIISGLLPSYVSLYPTIQVQATESDFNPTLKIGDYIQYGAYNGQPILWRVIYRDSNGNPLLFADRILTIKMFDSQGAYHAGNQDRVNYGSSYYPNSNLRQWLNSSANQIDWIQNDPVDIDYWSYISKGYANEKGFLADGNFTAVERKMIMPLQYNVELSSADSTRPSAVTDQVFLLSESMLRWNVLENKAILGATYHNAKPTPEAVTKSSYKSPSLTSDQVWSYWLSSPERYNISEKVRAVFTDGTVGSDYAGSNSLGVRPALQLNRILTHFENKGKGSETEPYVVTRQDMYSPTAPSGLHLAQSSSTSIEIGWTPSKDKHGVALYEIFKGNQVVGTVPHNSNATKFSFNVTGLTRDTSYSFSVQAKDESGNSSLMSEVFTAKTKTINRDMKIGDYIQFGTYNNAPILWRVIHVDSNGHPVVFSDRILSFKAFDAKGNYHAANGERANYGSNDYADSNLRQWLNSSSLNEGDDTIDWTQNDPKPEAMAQGKNGYDKEKGFLADGNFTVTERQLMKTASHDVILSNADLAKKDGGSELLKNEQNLSLVSSNYDSAYYQRVSDRVFLLSLKQLKEYVFDRRTTLGFTYYKAKPTPDAVSKSEIKSYFWNTISSNSYWEYWLNTPSTDNPYSVREMGAFAELMFDYVGSSSANSELVGVRPAIKLDMSTAIFNDGGNGTEVSPYVVNRDALVESSEAPTRPSGLKVTQVKNKQVSLQWEPSTDDDAVKSYGIFRNGELIDRVYTAYDTVEGKARPQDTTYVAIGLQPDTNYTFAVRAEDAQWNSSELTDAISVTTAEGVPPTKPSDLTAEDISTYGFWL